MIDISRLESAVRDIANAGEQSRQVRCLLEALAAGRPHGSLVLYLGGDAAAAAAAVGDQLDCADTVDVFAGTSDAGGVLIQLDALHPSMHPALRALLLYMLDKLEHECSQHVQAAQKCLAVSCNGQDNPQA